MLVLACGYAGYHLSERTGIRALAESGERQLELHARAVESEITKYTYLPSLLELEASVGRLLRTPTGYRRQLVNEYLEGLNLRSGSLAVYILDTDGRVVATSNWAQADSYLGEDLSFRAYFKDAMQGQPGRFYGIGSTVGEPGYYLAHGLRDGERLIGVAVVKVKLDALEERWARARLEAYVSDENGIIILSSNPARRLKSLRPLDEATRERLARSLQYHWSALEELQPLSSMTLGAGIEQVSFATTMADYHEPVSYLAQSRALSDTPWRLTLLTPMNDLRREALSHATLAAVACALLAFLLIAWNERRKVIATRLAAREALQHANGELERRIAERTADLRASNERLKRQIRERRQTESNLRKTQDELVQAGKLAVIGQMSTSIAHELNQPLAALRTLSANAVRFLQRGAHDTASANLQAIGDLVDRMGKITASLRAFARRSDDKGEAELEKALDAALFLLHARLQRLDVQIERQIETDAGTRLGIDQTRLEQILVNLVANALDAMGEQPERRLWLNGAASAGQYRLEVRDNGPGISPELRVHLFEPFFTTKPGEQGLGLGLTLSASLAAAAGGSLTVRHPAEGGSAFILCLKRIGA
ncbi:sensor histidine kinase [Stutzerimonas kirkiae]|uniref:C4-dicarboxylate transport sensor protein DctB n=1 Tax=Stutzerimonas kirkiae TaxID=2211392 RepID=A0A4Q9QX27_9GAMM|nr:ATP-binding protein [Stutzerimonas kirkiae]TBU89048.1 sensor histidine kinase [Stutzerimonas kirkiae]TBU99389.1 sensor histidine kinase [Stutzerimonas kirkiae]TBV03854.1 sensor histidine kinase [Stutzerimonas kirkiae]TBV14890.1 sensor histidine kinase [Stutzerimonas kirkiae]